MTDIPRSDGGDPAEPLLGALGVTPHFADDEGVEGPPVDREKLRRYADRTLGPHARAEVTDLVSSFRTWYEALCEVIREQGARPGQGT